MYILRCRDGTLYVGITNALEARLARHNAGRGAKYTRSRAPVELAWSRSDLAPTVARKAEHALKRLPRAAKLRLVAGDEGVWRGVVGPHPPG